MRDLMSRQTEPLSCERCNRLTKKCMPEQFGIILTNKSALLTLAALLDTIGRPGNANSFSTPPVSFQCISFLVGGARSSVVTMSVVSDSCSFIVSLGIPFCSSTISLRLRFPLFSVPPEERKNNRTQFARVSA